MESQSDDDNNEFNHHHHNNSNNNSTPFTISNNSQTAAGPVKLLNRQLVHIYVNFSPNYYTSEEDFVALINEIDNIVSLYVTLLLHDGITIQRSVPIQHVEKHIQSKNSVCLSFRWKFELDNEIYIGRQLTLQILMRMEEEKSFDGVLTKDILSANNKDRRRLRNFVNSSLQPLSNRFGNLNATTSSFSDQGQGQSFSTRLSTVNESALLILASGPIAIHEPAIVRCQWRLLEGSPQSSSILSVCVENRHTPTPVIVTDITVLLQSSLRISAIEAMKLKRSIQIPPPPQSETEIENEEDQPTQRTSLIELHAVASASSASSASDKTTNVRYSDWRNALYMSPLLKDSSRQLSMPVSITHRESYVFSYLITQPEHIPINEDFFVPVTIEVLANQEQTTLLRSYYVWNT